MDVSQATKSRTDGPTRLAMHTVEGFGKTTMLAHFPSPLIVGAENGIPRDLGFNVATIRPRTWMEQFELIHSLKHDKHSYRTLGYDTLDWIEPQIHQFVLARDSERETEMNPKGRKLLSIEDYGYGKGYLVAEEEFRKLISALDELQYATGMHIVLLMHSQVRSFKNPTGPDFDRYEPKCQSRIARVAIEWAENVLFGYFPVTASKEPDDVKRNEKTAKAKGMGSGVRMIGASQCAMYDAKNRVGLPNEFELPQSYDELLPVLLGENVPTNNRRAALRENANAGRGWADEQRAVASERARARAAQESDAPPPRDDRDPTDTGRMHSRAELDARERQPVTPPPRDDKRESREFTDPRRDAQTQPPPPREEPKTRAPDPSSSSPRHNGSAAPSTMQKRLDEALHFGAERKGDRYVNTVKEWIDKAAGDPNKLEAILKRVGSDMGMNF